MSRFIVFVLIVGVIIRLSLAASTFHADVRAFDLGGQIVSSGNVFNMYDYLSNLPQDDPLVKTYHADLLIYPPFIYLYHGLFSLLFLPFFTSTFIHSFLVDYQSVLGHIELNLHLLLLKSPYLIFDGLMVLFLSKLFQSEKDRKMAIIFWVFNPVNLYATYMMGQFDIIPTFFVVLALYFIQRGRSHDLYLASLSLGAGMAFKLYPFFLLTPLALSQTKVLDRLKLFLVGLLPYLLSVGPFIFSKGFHSSALLAGQTLKSLYAQIPISGGESILLFPLGLIFCYLVFANSKSKETLWEKFFVILLLFFIFTHYHPQWFLWLSPFLIIDLVKNQLRHIWQVSLAILSFTALLFFFDSGLTQGLFSPLIPGLYNSPTIWQLLHLNVDHNLARSIFQTIFAAVGAYFIFYYFPRKTGN